VGLLGNETELQEKDLWEGQKVVLPQFWWEVVHKVLQKVALQKFRLEVP